MRSPLQQQSWNKYLPFSFSSVTSCFPITPFHISVPVPTCALKSPLKTVDSVADTRWRASFTSSTKAWYSLVALGAYTCNRHNDRSNTLSFNIQTRDPKGIQSDTQSDKRGLVKIPTPAWADVLGSAPGEKSFHSLSRAMSFGWRNSDNIDLIPLCFLNQFYFFSCEGDGIPILSNSSWWWLTSECATLSRVQILCAASIHFSKREAGKLVKLPLGLAGEDWRYFSNDSLCPDKLLSTIPN